MPTTDERREVTALLRKHEVKVCLCWVLGWPLKCESFDCCEDCKDYHLKRLADLIEPEPERTCEMYRDEDGVWHCKSCEDGADKITGSDGELNNWCDSWHPNFCPNCGCRVKED